MPVVDSSPLIYLAKVGKLHLLRELYGSLKLPTSVYNEVVERGEERGVEDAIRVKQEMGRFLFVHKAEKETIDKVVKHLRKFDFQLGGGEIECVALCLDFNDRVFLSDDEDAKKFAKVYGIEGKGIIYVLLKSFKEGHMSKGECVETFERIVESGLWVNAEVVSLFYRTLERLGQY